MGWLIAGIIAVAVAATATTAGTIASSVSQNKANEANKATAEQNLAYSKENFEYQKQLQQQIFQREDTAYQRKVADLKAAGLNTQLALGGGSPSGSVVQTTAPYNPYQQQAVDYGDLGGSAIGSLGKMLMSFPGAQESLVGQKLANAHSQVDLGYKESLHEHEKKVWKMEEDILGFKAQSESFSPEERKTHLATLQEQLHQLETYGSQEREAGILKTLTETEKLQREADRVDVLKAFDEVRTGDIKFQQFISLLRLKSDLSVNEAKALLDKASAAYKNQEIDLKRLELLSDTVGAIFGAFKR